MPITWLHLSDLHRGQQGDVRWSRAKDVFFRDLEARVGYRGQADHLEPMISLGQVVRFVGRVSVGDEDDAIQFGPNPRFFGDEEVGIVDGIEGAAEYSDFGFWILDFGFPGVCAMRIMS